ncbi:MAG: hypothetical protein ACFCUR_03050 [Rhodomicrobiaceae bacterium]
MQRHIAARGEAHPRLFRSPALLAALGAGIGRRGFVNPCAASVAIEADGGEIADPFQMRRGGQIDLVVDQQRIALSRWRRGMQQDVVLFPSEMILI